MQGVIALNPARGNGDEINLSQTSDTKCQNVSHVRLKGHFCGIASRRSRNNAVCFCKSKIVFDCCSSGMKHNHETDRHDMSTRFMLRQNGDLLLPVQSLCSCTVLVVPVLVLRVQFVKQVYVVLIMYSKCDLVLHMNRSNVL